jgi:hypothetical protein
MSAEVSVRVGSIVGFYTPAAKVEQLEHRVSERCKELGPFPREMATHISHRRYLATMAFSDHDSALLAVRFPSSVDDVPVVFGVYNKTEVDGLATDGEEFRELVADLSAACERHRDRTSGRLVMFRGSAALGELVSVETLVSSTVIERVDAFGLPVEPGDSVLLKGYARPILVEGETVLHVTPLANGGFVTYEIADPHQCCDGHH